MPYVYCIPLFWWNYIHAIFFFWYILLLVPACLELMLWEIDGKSHAFSMGKRYHRMGIWWKKVPMLWGKYGYQFPRLFWFDGFRCIFQYYGELMGKRKHFPCDEVNYRMRIWLEKCTHTMAKIWVPISQTFAKVLLHFPVLWEIDGKTHAFLIWWSIPKDGNLMEKSTHTMEKVWGLISQALPIWCFSLNFSHAIGNWLEYPYFSHVMKSPIRLESNRKKAPILWEKYEYQFPRPSRTMGCVAFFCAMENSWENPYISHMMKYTIGWESDGKKYSYYGKSMITNFPGSPHTMGFIALSYAMGNWWENPNISHMMRFVNFFPVVCLFSPR